MSVPKFSLRTLLEGIAGIAAILGARQFVFSERASLSMLIRKSWIAGICVCVAAMSYVGCRLPPTLTRRQIVLYTAVLGGAIQALTATVLTIEGGYHFRQAYPEYFDLQAVWLCLILIFKQFLLGSVLGIGVAQLILLARSKT